MIWHYSYLYTVYKNLIFKNNIVSNKRGIQFFHAGRNDIIANNFIGNNNDTFFFNTLDLNRFFSSYFKIKNRFFGNYWNESGLTVKTINCEFKFWTYNFTIPGKYYDWYPAQKPYDIPIPEVF